MLSAADRAELRRLIEPTLTARAAVQRLVRTKTGPATYTDVWTTVAGQEALPCKFRVAAAPAEIATADAVRAVSRYTVTMVTGTAVDASQRLVVTHTEPGVPSPLTLDVIGPLYRSGEVTRRVLAERAG